MILKRLEIRLSWYCKLRRIFTFLVSKARPAVSNNSLQPWSYSRDREKARAREREGAKVRLRGTAGVHARTYACMLRLHVITHTHTATL